MKSGIELIANERQEQITKHGRTIESDLEFNSHYQLKDAALDLIEHITQRSGFTPPEGWDLFIYAKMIGKPYKERLIIAGALLAAEIDRVNEYKSKSIALYNEALKAFAEWLDSSDYTCDEGQWFKKVAYDLAPTDYEEIEFEKLLEDFRSFLNIKNK